MPPPRPPRRWSRRLWRILGVVAALLVVALVVLWFSLPRLVRSAFDRATAAAGFTEASIEVERADLSGLRAKGMVLRLGGLDVRLAEAAADYSITSLINGRISRLAIDGLATTLDFTQPRRGLLPDAIADLEAQMGEGGGELVWPVDELILRDCRIELILPEGTQTFTLSGKATRRGDGRVAFELNSNHPEQEMQVSGVVRTETMEGELTLDRLAVQPQFLLALLEQLDLWRMPEGVATETDRVELSGTAVLRGGEPESYSVHVQAPRAQVTTPEVTAVVTQLDATAARAADGNITANLKAELTGQGRATPWSVRSMALQLAVDRGTMTLTTAPFAGTFDESIAAEVAVTLTAGIPPLGGAAQGTLELAVSAAEFAGLSLAPFAINASGGAERVTISARELGLAENSPATLRDLVVEVTDPLGAGGALEVSANLDATAGLAGFLPAGWRLVEPVLPARVLRLSGHAAGGDTGPGAQVVLTGGFPQLALAAEAGTFTCVPACEINFGFADGALTVTGVIDATGVESTLPNFPPGVRALRFGLDVPATPVSALLALASGEVPSDELAAKISGTIMQSETRGDAYVAVRHFGDASEWSAEVWGMLDNVNGAWAGANVTGLRAEATIDSGRLPDAQIDAWLAAPEVIPLVRAMLPRTKVDVSLTAANVDFPGTGGTEWAGFWLQKPAAPPDGPPLQAGLTFYSGILRAGPETIEQPRIEAEISGTLEQFALRATAHALLEGAELAMNGAQEVQFDWTTLVAQGAGTFECEPITLANSDIVTRWVPEARNVAITATATTKGVLHWSSDGNWDGTAEIALTNGTFNHPDQGIRVEGLNTAIAFTSLRDLRTAQQQPISFARLAIGEVEVTNASARFSSHGGDRLVIDTLSARIFGGEVSVGAFALAFPNPDVGTSLEFSGLDAGQLMREVEFFKGTMSGKLRGRLPVGLISGRPFLGEGYLELDPSVPARFSMDARGLFTTDLPNETRKDKMVRLPYEIAEEALGDIAIHAMRVDLFRADTPGTPIRIEFSGESVTPRARVPMNIVTRVNGSVPEALNFLFRLATL